MPTESVFCLAGSREQADEIVNRVRQSGFRHHDLSALFPVPNADPAPAPEEYPSQERIGQIALSRSEAWRSARKHGFANVGALNIPGIGHVVAGGPIILALSVAISGGDGVTGLARALMGMGLGEQDANRYENGVRAGNVLFSIRSGDATDITLAKTIFRESGADSICATNDARNDHLSAPERASKPPQTVSCPFEAADGGTFGKDAEQALRLKTAAAGLS